MPTLVGTVIPVEPVQGADTLDVTTRTPVRDLLLGPQVGGNPNEYDLVLDAGGNIQTVSGTAAIAQHIRMRLLLFLGEMYNDVQEGTPYFQSIFVKGVDANVMQAAFRDRIAGTPGVVSVDSLKLTFDRPNRALYVKWAVTTTTGQLLTDLTAVAVTAAPGAA